MIWRGGVATDNGAIEIQIINQIYVSGTIGFQSTYWTLLTFPHERFCILATVAKWNHYVTYWFTLLQVEIHVHECIVPIYFFFLPKAPSGGYFKKKKNIKVTFIFDKVYLSFGF